MNVHIKDGKSNLSRVSSLIKPAMSDEDVEVSIMYFAFGMERLCKGALVEINPALALMSSTYQDIVVALYSRFLIDNASFEGKNKGNSDYCGFSELIKRSSHFNKSINEHKGVLHNLRNYRNTFAHNEIQYFDHGSIREWLFGIFHPVVKSISEEIGVDSVEVFGADESALLALSENARYREKLQKRVEGLLQVHRDIWNGLKAEVREDQLARLTKLDLDQTRKSHENSYEPFECPACGNKSVLEIEPDYDYSDGESYVTGVYPIELRCHYCNLKVVDPEILSYLKTDEWWVNYKT